MTQHNTNKALVESLMRKAETQRVPESTAITLYSDPNAEEQRNVANDRQYQVVGVGSGEDGKTLEEKLAHIVDVLPSRYESVMGSTAGSGSGDFHTYRTARRREQNRLQRIEEAAKMAEEKDNLQQKRKLYQIEADERTKKNREKRLKKKLKAQEKKKTTVDNHHAEYSNKDYTTSGNARNDENVDTPRSDSRPKVIVPDDLD